MQFAFERKKLHQRSKIRVNLTNAKFVITTAKIFHGSHFQKCPVKIIIQRSSPCRIFFWENKQSLVSHSLLNAHDLGEFAPFPPDINVWK